MARGRPLNLLRANAKMNGERFFAAQYPCDFCGTNSRYVSSAGCVACAISRGSMRYRALDEDQRAAIKCRDRDRYVARSAS